MSKHYSIQLQDHRDGAAIIDTGGVCYVAVAGGAAKIAVAITKAGAQATSNNPVALTTGKIEFWTADSVSSVDLYGIGPNGHAFKLAGVKPSGNNALSIDQGQMQQVMLIPFSAADVTANTETATGFTEPANALMLPSVAIRVLTLDATETVDVGTLSSDSGDADGFIDGLSLAAVGVVKATVANGSDTMGALLVTQDSANAGDLALEAHVSAAKAITLTTSAGTDTAAGFIALPYMLAA